MEYKILDEKWKLNIRDLWRECFHDSEEYMDWYFDTVFNKNLVFGAVDENQLISMVHLNPYKLCVFGEMIDSHYIVGVATDPLFRKKGIMKELMKHALNYLMELGEDVTYLMPENDAYYISLGFEKYEESFVYELDKAFAIMDERADISKEFKVIKPADDVSEKELADFFNRYMKTVDAAVYIDKQEFYDFNHECIAENGRAYAIFKNGEIVSTFGVMKENDGDYMVSYKSMDPSMEQIKFVYDTLKLSVPEYLEVFGKKVATDIKHISLGKGIMFKCLSNRFTKSDFCDKILCINEIV